MFGLKSLNVGADQGKAPKGETGNEADERLKGLKRLKGLNVKWFVKSYRLEKLARSDVQVQVAK